jgi:hypothetical protein
VADHEFGQPALIALGRRQVGDLAAAAQDGDAVRGGDDLRQLVRNEDDAETARSQFLQVANRVSDSCGVRTAVGSSSTSTLASR